MNQSRTGEEGNRDVDQVNGTEVEGDRNFPEDEERVLPRAEIDGFDEEDKEVLKKMLHEIRNSPKKIPPNLRYMERKKVKAATSRVNKIVPLVVTGTITKTNTALKAAGNVASELVEYKAKTKNENTMPHCRRRIVEKQKALGKDLGQVNRWRRNELHSKGAKERLERLYHLNLKGVDVVHEELQQRLIAIGAKLERYDNRTEQYRQNRFLSQTRRNCLMIWRELKKK